MRVRNAHTRGFGPIFAAAAPKLAEMPLRLAGLFLLALAPAASVLAQAHDVLAGPVRLAGYAKGVAVEWQAYDETEVDYYAVRRSLDGETRTIASLEPRGVLDTFATYRFIDQTAFAHDLAYELRVVFVDGSYAETESLPAQAAHSRRTRLLRALDEESLARLHFTLDSDARREVVVRVDRLGGETIETFTRELAPGVNDIEVDYGAWGEGYYSVLLDQGDQPVEWIVHVDPSVPRATTRRLTPRS